MFLLVNTRLIHHLLMEPKDDLSSKVSSQSYTDHDLYRLQMEKLTMYSRNARFYWKSVKNWILWLLSLLILALKILPLLFKFLSFSEPRYWS